MTDVDVKDTKERILDAAEELFAVQGFDASSLRAVTSAAGVNLAAVNYHFGSKEALLAQVLGRRLRPLNERRIAALEEARSRAGGGAPSIEAIVRALLAPTFEFLADLGADGVHFVRLAGRALNDPSPNVRGAFLAWFGDLAKTFHAALAEAMPGLTSRDVSLRLHFIIGAMAHVLAWSRHDAGDPVMSMNVREDAPEALREQLIAFCVAGVQAGTEHSGGS